MLIDLHNHVLPGVDDGSRHLAMSYQMIDMAIAQGVTTLVCTPHEDHRYTQNYYVCHQLMKQLQQYAGDHLDLLLGMEVRLSERTLADIKRGSIWGLNQSRYVLVELPHRPHGMIEILQGIRQLGLEPVLAHPERYAFFQQDADLLQKFLDLDLLLQVNVSSLLGTHRIGPQRLGYQLLDAGKVACLASDAHELHRRPIAAGETLAILGESSWLKSQQVMQALLANAPRETLMML